MIGKWHLGTGSRYHPQEHGFDEFYGFLTGTHRYSSSDTHEPDWAALQRGTQRVEESGYLTDAIGREAVDFVRRNAALPFFLCASFNAVHIPIEAPERYTARFAHVEDEKRRAYCGMVSALDDAVGGILDALVEVGVDQRTLVVFTNDNGVAVYTEVQSNGPLRLGKMYLFEGGIRVPLIVRWRGLTASDGVCEATVSALDLFPTLTAAAGLAEAVERGLDGVDLLARLRGEAEAPERPLFWRNGPNHAVRAGSWKLVAAGEHTWLFDLRNDLSETTNLATRYPEVTGDLKLAFERWEAEMEAPRWPGHFLGDRHVDGVPYPLLP
jgi:arylsulfatase A-like enzyme